MMINIIAKIVAKILIINRALTILRDGLLVAINPIPPVMPMTSPHQTPAPKFDIIGHNSWGDAIPTKIICSSPAVPPKYSCIKLKILLIFFGKSFSMRAFPLAFNSGFIGTVIMGTFWMTKLLWGLELLSEFIAD